MSGSSVPVDSTVIAEIGHDPDTNILEVRFHNGRIYHHFMVPRSEYEALISAESIGAHFNRLIRPRYRSTRMDGSLV
ncbi:MAG: KTSC domain-containing protein [Acidobacteriota bacterium]|nr:KTSC domain-containing protein [Acidobacteriota bacterium]